MSSGGSAGAAQQQTFHRRSLLRAEGIRAATGEAAFPGRGQKGWGGGSAGSGAASAMRRRIAASAAGHGGAATSRAAKVAVARLNLRNGWIRRGGRGAFHSLGAHVQVEGGKPGARLAVHTFSPYDGEDGVSRCLEDGSYNLAVSVRVPKASKALRKDEQRGFLIVFGYQNPTRFFSLSANLHTHVWAVLRHGSAAKVPVCVQSHYQPPASASRSTTRFKVLLQVRGDSVTVDVNDTPFFTSVRHPGQGVVSMAGTVGVAARGGQHFVVSEFAVFPPDVTYVAPQPAPRGVAGAMRGHKPSGRSFVDGSSRHGRRAPGANANGGSGAGGSNRLVWAKQQRVAMARNAARGGGGGVGGGGVGGGVPGGAARAARDPSETLRMMSSGAVGSAWATTPLFPSAAPEPAPAASDAGVGSASSPSSAAARGVGQGLMAKLLAGRGAQASGGVAGEAADGAEDAPPANWADLWAHTAAVTPGRSGVRDRTAARPTPLAPPPAPLRLSPTVRAAAAASAATMARRASPAAGADTASGDEWEPPVKPQSPYRRQLSASELAGDDGGYDASSTSNGAGRAPAQAWEAPAKRQDHAAVAAAAGAMHSGARDGWGGAAGGMPVPRYAGDDQALVESVERDILAHDLRVSFDDIAALDDAKRLLNEAVALPLLVPEFFTGIRKPWKGVLLFGPPGTGKTLLAKAVASMNNVTFFNASAASLVSRYHGESEKLVRCLFNMARHYAPSIIFIDEIDSLLSTRGSSTEHEASRRLKTEFLVQMDGLASAASAEGTIVVVMATTNAPWLLDEALCRRLEKRIYIPLPDATAREQLFELHLKGVPTSPDVNIPAFADMTEGYSGADIQLLCREASMVGMRRLLAGKTPADVVAMRAAGQLSSPPVSAADLLAAMKATSRSVGTTDLERYEAWARERGST